MPKAVVLLSGGLDSATVLAIALSEGLECTALTIDYGQRHRIELDAARAVAASLGVADHRFVKVELGAIGGSALTDDLEVPKVGKEQGIPITYVPARNTVFLSIALGLAEVVGANDIFVGVNAVDYSGYPDCRPEFINAFQQLARLATRVGVEGGSIRIRAPLIELTKAQIIQRGIELGVDYGLTTSCYDPIDGVPCGLCDACRLRAKGFEKAGAVDFWEWSGA